MTKTLNIPWFKGGRQLSGGQWQRIALSRAFMRDAENEHLVFSRIKETTPGRIALLVSHRLGTVRMADQIVVLRQGRIEESGTHEELISQGGATPASSSFKPKDIDNRLAFLPSRWVSSNHGK